MVISGYYIIPIGDILLVILVVINVIILMTIGGYSIVSRWWLFY
jgi:hypothetical protein